MLQLRVFLLAPFLNKYNRVVVDHGWYPLNGLNGWYLKKRGGGQGGEFRNFDSVSLVRGKQKKSTKDIQRPSIETSNLV